MPTSVRVFFRAYINSFGYGQLVLKYKLMNGMLGYPTDLLNALLDGEHFNLFMARSRSGRRSLQGGGNIFIEFDRLPILFLLFLLRKLIASAPKNYTDFLK